MLPTRIWFGVAAREHLAGEVKALGIRCPLIVSDQGIAEAGLLDDLRVPSTCVTYTGLHTNPSEAEIVAGARLYQRSQCDGIIAVGGGSVIDAAKLIGLLVSHTDPLDRYDDAVGGGERITRSLPPTIAVPTTAGTGSEVGRAALVMLGQPARKALIRSDFLMPTVAIVDPELTVGLPPLLTAATGMDALSHCIEELFSPRYHPLINTLAAEGVRLIWRHLPRAVADGEDLEAREAMMQASIFAGLGFAKGLGPVHALSHPLASLGAHHGMVNGILLPHVYRFNAVAAPAVDEQIRNILEADRGDEALTALIRDCNLPDRLAEVGLLGEDIPRMASMAVAERAQETSPRALTFDDACGLYRDALQGRS